jgi:hypothetical protein
MTALTLFHELQHDEALKPTLDALVRVYTKLGNSAQAGVMQERIIAIMKAKLLSKAENDADS